MKKNLDLIYGIIEGEVKRTILKIFPDIESSFTQRKNYDEYFFDMIDVEVTIDIIEQLVDSNFKVTIDSYDITIE